MLVDVAASSHEAKGIDPAGRDIRAVRVKPPKSGSVPAQEGVKGFPGLGRLKQGRVPKPGQFEERARLTVRAGLELLPEHGP
jgi:hypothetical protein